MIKTNQANRKPRWRKIGNRCYELSGSSEAYVIVMWTTSPDYPWRCENVNFETESEAKNFGKIVFNTKQKEQTK